MKKQTRNFVILVSALGFGLLVAALAAGMMIIRSGITAGPDQMFGDQHLKTAVAVIELHKVRTGSYPEAMSDIQFAGAWDGLALSRVSYRTSADRTAYYVEVERGWLAKPVLEISEGFWTGTGYDPSLEEEAVMSASGTFEVELTPQEDVGSPAGRMLIKKTYRGDMDGSGAGQMISKRTETGSAIYCAIEEYSGSVKGKSGGFTLVHRGTMSKESQSLEITILEGSGSGELQGISGSMAITQDADGHSFELTFEL